MNIEQDIYLNTAKESVKIFFLDEWEGSLNCTLMDEECVSCYDGEINLHESKG